MSPHHDVTWLDYTKRALFVSAFVFIFISPCVAYLKAFHGNWLVSLVCALGTGVSSTVLAWWID